MLTRRAFLVATAGSLLALAGLARPAASQTPEPTRLSLLPTGTPAAAPVPEATRAPVQGEIEFAYYNWGPDSIQFFKDLAAAFEQEYPNTKIQLTLPPVDQYSTKLKILLATGQGPDVITTTEITLRLFKENRLMDLTELVKQDPVLLDSTRFIQAGWDIYRFGTDRIYGIYTGADTLLLYYNKTLFDKAGLKYPTPEWTWNDFLEAAKQLTVVEGDRTVQWGTTSGSLEAWWGMENLVWMEGGDIADQRPFLTRLTLNNEPVIKVLRFIQDMIYTHKVAPTPAQSQELGQQGGEFETGKVAMVIDGGWSIQSRKQITAFEWDIQMLPRGSAGFVAEFWPGQPMQISASAKNPELAWAFIRWIAASKTGQEFMAKQLIMVPGRLDIALSPTFLAQPGLPPTAQAWVQSLQQARPADLFHERLQEMMDKVWTPNWDKFRANKLKPEEFAATVESEGNAILTQA